jgi:hypothetical protein
MFCDWVSYPTMAPEVFSTSLWESSDVWNAVAAATSGCPALDIKVTGQNEAVYEAFSDTVKAWSDGYYGTLRLTLDANSLPTAAGETAYCFGKDITATAAPSGAYCYIIETKDDSGVFSTVGADLPELVFITSENFGTGAVTST